MAINYIGESDFTQIGAGKWSAGGFGLDRLRVRYRGSRDDLDSFLSGLNDWDPSDIDGNMYLEEYDNDDDPVQPTVEVTYTGCRNGVLPSVARKRGFTLQTASANDDGVGANLEVLYRAPHIQYTWIGNSDDMTHSGYTGDPPTILIRRIDGAIPLLYRFEDFIRQSVAYGAATDAQRTRIDAWLNENSAFLENRKEQLNAFFNRSFTVEDDTEFEATEIVPDRLWSCTATTRRLLVSPGA